MIYLDNGATSFPKPKSVSDAVYKYMTAIGSNINRGGYEKAYSAAETVLETRELCNKMFNGYGSRNVIFTPGNTYSLNFLINGLAKKGDTFLISSMEHNAVYRPCFKLEKDGLINLKYMPANTQGELLLEESLAMIDESIDGVIMVHASNVSGTVLPIMEIGEKCFNLGIPFIVDAAQTAGNTPIDIQKCHISGLAMPAHKSMLSPQGLGIMMLEPTFAQKLTPIISGGTGSHSDMADMPKELPDRFESGTLNLPGIFGLNAGIKWLNENFDKIRKHEYELTEYMLNELKNIKNINIIGKTSMENRTSVISIDFFNDDNGIKAFELEHEYGIMTRVGLHCAVLAHKTLGTFPRGTIRFSIGPFNTKEEIDMTISALKKLSKK